MNEWEVEELAIEVAEHLEGYRPLVRPGHPAYLMGPMRRAARRASDLESAGTDQGARYLPRRQQGHVS